jgi:hypothetical protein
LKGEGGWTLDQPPNTACSAARCAWARPARRCTPRCTPPARSGSGATGRCARPARHRCAQSKSPPAWLVPRPALPE